MPVPTIIARGISAYLALSLLVTPLPAPASAQSGLISTDRFLARGERFAKRGRVLDLLEKEDVRMRLQELGISAEEAKARISGLSEAELMDLDRKLDELPAGKDATGAIIGAVLAVFIVLLLTDILCLTKVFPFTRCAGGRK